LRIYDVDSVAARFCAAQLEVGEAPRWIDGRLVFVDLLSGVLYENDGRRESPARRMHSLPVPLGAVAPVAGSPGAWIVAAGRGIAVLSATGHLDWLGRPARGGSAPRRMNDGGCDPSGRFWACCTAWDTTPDAGALFRVDHDGTVIQVLDGLTIPNGPAFTRDGTRMYLADSHRRVVHQYSVEPVTGDLGEGVLFRRFDAGSPDGMTVDVDGNLWVALWGCGEVRQYAPDGAHRATVRVPARQPTAPCLGGPDGTTLYITTARYGLGANATDVCGDIFAVDVVTPGVPAARFGQSVVRAGSGPDC
jgi:sugar lactone lactonase YvrE